MKRIVKFAPLLVAAACSAVGPNWSAPKAQVTARFVDGEASPAAQMATRAWWQDYRDPTLSVLISRGLQQNLDVKTAQERIAQANAQLRQTGVNAALSGSASAGRQLAGTTSGDERAFQSTGDLSAGFVIDLFGGLRRQREAARASLQAAQADVGTVRLAWLAEVVSAYADARYDQEALALTRDTIASREKTLEITRQQLEAGSTTAYGLAEAQASLETARADLPQYLALFRANVFALAALLDEPAGPLLETMQRGAAPLPVPRNQASGVPADLLRNRPDLVYYEALLHQQVAGVGVAEADLLPSLSLSGSVSAVESTKTWAFGPSISLALLNRGQLLGARDAQISAAKQAELTWRGAVNDAVRDVQVAQSNLAQYRQRSAALSRAAEAYRTALSLAQENFQSGQTSLLDLLDTDRSEAAAKISAASARNDAAKEWASLQIALGAGAAVGALPQEAP